jgi:hypothetical protein
MKQSLSTLNAMRIRRAHESPQHPQGKRALGQLLARREFLVLFEHQLADLVAFRIKDGKLRVLCGEHELTRRNLCRNVRRNFANGCHGMILLVPTGADEAARGLLRREFARSIWARIGIITHEKCQHLLAQELAYTKAMPSVAVAPASRTQISHPKNKNQ